MSEKFRQIVNTCALYSCRLTLTVKPTKAFILMPLSVCLCICACLQSFYNTSGVLVGRWVLLPIYYQAGLNSKCSLTHNFPGMSIRHEAEQALLVSG